MCNNLVIYFGFALSKKFQSDLKETLKYFQDIHLKKIKGLWYLPYDQIEY